jgi:amidase
MSAVGLGTDFGGSVRWPAHCTGLSSLRPTAGRVPGDGQLPGRVRGDRLVLDPQSAQGRLQVIGPIGRTVADVRAMAAVLAGNVPGPDSAAAAWSPEPVDLSQVRVAWCDGEGTVPVMGELRRAVGRAAVLLAAEVAGVAESLPAALEEAGELFGALRATDRQDDVRALGDPSMFGETIRELLRGTPEPAPAAVAALWARRDRLRADMLAQMPDLLLMPVASIPAPGLEDRSFVVEGRRLDVWQVLTPCRAISLFGLPVATVPVGRMPDGAPIGVQVVGRPDGDEVVLAAAEALERLCAS